MLNIFVIEKDKLVSNINIVKKKAGNSKIYAVVKGDGYGLGLLRFAEILRDNGINAFAVTEPEEVLALRDAGFKDSEILMLRSTAIADEIETLIKNDAVLTLGSNDAAAAANGIAGKLEKKARAHIKIDTGMGRYGFNPNAAESVKSLFEYMTNIEIEGLYTHLNRAYKSRKTTIKQINTLFDIEKKLKDSGYSPGCVHFAGSSVLFKYNIDLRDAVRIGSAFVGRLAVRCKNSGLEKIGYLQSRVCEVRWLDKGQTVGYGSAYRASRPVKIAVIPLGFRHGFGVSKIRDTYRIRDGLMYVLSDIKKTILGEKIYVTINGKKARSLGHIGVLHTVADVTKIQCETGDIARFDINPLYVSESVEKTYV